uniref:PH domain-containing protein n=1 Tax=Heterosigma akashiwo TaxID=2829 RepID=A0A7S4D7Y8_HETAK
MDESTLIDLVSHLSIRIGALSPGVSTDTIEDEAEIQDVLYEGWLYKRNAVGYSNWKKRWFMLAGPVLLWWRSPEARRVSPRHPLGLLNIIGGEIRRTKAFRWQILGVIQPKALESKAIPDMATDGKAALERESEEGTSVAKGQGDDLLDRELSATGPAEMEEWIGRLLLAMRGYAQPSSPQSASSEVGDCRPSAASQNGVQYSFGGDGEDEDLVPVVFSAAPRSVRAWLGSLGLSALWPTFKKKGYTDISHIRTFGLVDEDLDYLGITKKQHRHTLKKVVQAIYSPELEVKIESAVLIPGHAEEGKRSKEQPQLQIRARARHGLARSAARVPWAEVEAADADLRATLAGSPLLLRRFPKLPRFGRGTYERNTGQNKKKVVYLVKQDFLKSVKQYFDEVVPLLRGAEPYLSMLRGLFKLEYVDIYSQTDEEEDEYDDDEVDDAFVEQYLSGSLEAGQFSIRQQEKQTV